jgi:hypothetical protein
MTTKWNIIFAAVLLVMIWAMLSPSSKEYWQGVGPAWDKMYREQPVD